MQDNHQTQPDVDLEFDLVRATIWDSIWTEVFRPTCGVSEAEDWHFATSKVLEVLDDPSEEGDDLFEEVVGIVANAQGDAWALLETEASDSVGPINDVIGRAVDEVIGLFFPAPCCVEGCGHYDGDDPVAQRIWAEWNGLPDDELSPVKTIASTLGLTNAEVAVVVYPPDSYGPWADDHEPMRPWLPTKGVTLVDPSSRTVEVGMTVRLGFWGPEGNERLWVRVLDPLDDGSGWIGALATGGASLPIGRDDLVTFEDRHVLETAAECAAAKQPVAFPVECVGQVSCEDDTIEIGGLVIEDFLGGEPASVWVRKVGDDPDDQSVCEIIVAPYLCDGQYVQEELDAQNAAAAVYPLGPKEYWRGKTVGHWTFGIDGHLMTDAEFEEEYWCD